MAGKRDAKGHWLPGHSGNPNGRARRSAEDRAILALDEVVTEEEWRKIWAVALARAKAGDVAFARLLAYYKFGKPVERHIVASDADVQLTWGDGDDED